MTRTAVAVVLALVVYTVSYLADKGLVTWPAAVVLIVVVLVIANLAPKAKP